MSQRLVAAVLAAPAIAALLLYAAFSTLPYATYEPGGTVDVLGVDDNDAEIIQVDGAETYRDDGQLRMTTVRVSPPAPKGETGGDNLVALLTTWLDGDNAVYPYSVVHDTDETPESSRQEGQVQMSTSQDTAVAIALAEMGEPVPQVLKVAQLTPGLPAEKVLRVGDVIRTVDGKKVADGEALVKAISSHEVGDDLTIGVTRDGRQQSFTLAPVAVPDDPDPKIGILPGVGYADFPFEVKINVPQAIGGPSAGLIFSLAVYDTLTDGSMTGGHRIAGTGEIEPDGSVGPIGGIQQKIAGARDDGVELFLVPIENCADALKADPQDMKLMMAQTMHDVRVALEAYAADEDAELPSCEDAADILSGAAQ